MGMPPFHGIALVKTVGQSRAERHVSDVPYLVFELYAKLLIFAPLGILSSVPFVHITLSHLIEIKHLVSSKKSFPLS
jgi:hypothetical protein